MSEGQTAPVFFSGTYEEAFDLLVETRDYIEWEWPLMAAKQGHAARLAANGEAMRLTTRLIQVMAWLMVQKAIHAGELTREEADNDTYRMSGEAECLDWKSARALPLPVEFRSLMDRSYDLYCRIRRLDRRAAAAGAAI